MITGNLSKEYVWLILKSGFYLTIISLSSAFFEYVILSRSSLSRETIPSTTLGTGAHKCAPTPTKEQFTHCSKNEQSACHSLKKLLRDIFPHSL